MEIILALIILPPALFAAYCMLMWACLWIGMFVRMIWAALTGKL